MGHHLQANETYQALRAPLRTTVASYSPCSSRVQASTSSKIPGELLAIRVSTLRRQARLT